MLNEFIEKILVHERDRKGSIQTTQEVEIYFNLNTEKDDYSLVALLNANHADGIDTEEPIPAIITASVGGKIKPTRKITIPLK